MNAKQHLKENVTYRVFDAWGRQKDVFQPNALFVLLMKWGILSPRFVKVPVLLGRWDSQMQISNLITNAGKAAAAGLLGNTGSITAFSYIAVGTGTTAANAADTTLETEITDSGLERAASTVSRVTTDVTNDTTQFLHSFTVTGTKAVTESGVLNASSSGILLCRQVFSAVNVVNGDTLQITWKIDHD